MTGGEAKMLEADAVIFPMNVKEENQTNDSIEETRKEITVEEKSIEVRIRDRFARLKKSLPSRSAGIL